MEAINIIEDLQFIKTFKRKLRKKDYCNSTIISIETANLFKDVIRYTIQNKIVNTYAELLSLIRHLGTIFIAVDPMQFSIGNVIKRILYIIREEIDKSISFQGAKRDSEANVKRIMSVTSLNRLIDYKTTKALNRADSIVNNEDDEEKEDLPLSPEMKEGLDNILKNIEELITELDTISEAIKDQAKDHINEGEIILTANHSDQLEEFFIEAKQSKNFKVIVAESAPSLNGTIQAKNLIAKGIDTTVVSDAAVYAIMPKVNKVIIGTRSIMANGGLISYNGVYNVCLCAQMFNIPVIVVGGTFKLTPMFPFGHETFNEFLSPDVIYGKEIEYKGDLSNIKFYTPAYDYVPPELVTVYITNHGSQNPAYIYRLFSELYSQEDYFLY